MQPTITHPVRTHSTKRPYPHRVIGRYIGEEKGPLFIVFGAMHGNELAGVQAVQQVLYLLEQEAETNADFVFSGQLIGLYGNWRAMQEGQRYIKRDLNRQWTSQNIARIQQLDSETLEAEDAEIHELLTCLLHEIQTYQPEEIVILDLHTTSAQGGIFSIVSEELKSLQIAVDLHAPVITGMMQGLEGTSLHYFSTALFNIPTTTLVFESGQHIEPDSTKRAISAIISCLRSIRCVEAFVVESRHDHLLIEYARPLPKVTELVYMHRISEEDHFKMKAGFKNFDRIEKGQLLATDKNGKILSPTDGLILMPLYQQQGENGFFIVKEVYHGAY
ncbi:MAG: succinylglutamate desuccinylase/aspartoacylase family protein [Bacteroidota bacterium]